MVKLAIIEDEPKTRSLLRTLLQEAFDWIEISGEADSVESAQKLIKETSPQVLLLDIQLTDGQAFDLLANMDKMNIYIVFVTAYDQYAIKALRAGAIDYIEKPINPEELYFALNRIRTLIETADYPDYNEIIRALKPRLHTRIAFPTGVGMKYLESSNISYVKAEGSYSKIHFEDCSEPILISRILRIIEPHLIKIGFVRVHRSYLVNTLKIVEVIKSDGGAVKLTDGTTIPFSRKYKNEALLIIKKNVLFL